MWTQYLLLFLCHLHYPHAFANLQAGNDGQRTVAQRWAGETNISVQGYGGCLVLWNQDPRERRTTEKQVQHPAYSFSLRYFFISNLPMLETEAEIYMAGTKKLKTK